MQSRIFVRAAVAGLGLLAATAACGGESRWVPVQPSDGPVAFEGVDVLPMTGDGLQVDQTVVVLDGRIVGLGPRGSVDVPEQAAVVDGTGRVLMPGLAGCAYGYRKIVPDLQEDGMRTLVIEPLGFEVAEAALMRRHWLSS